jgi:hypothetical protein
MYKDEQGHWHISKEWIRQWTGGMRADAEKLVKR